MQLISAIFDDPEAVAAAVRSRELHVSMSWKGRTLLGEVTALKWNHISGGTLATVRHFNGEPWPTRAMASALTIIERT